MRKLIMGLGLVAAVLGLTGCMPNKIEPSEVGVIVKNTGTDRGVDMYPAKSGWNWVSVLTESIYSFKTYDQNKNLDEISFGDQDGASITAKVGITISALPDAAPTLFLKYRSDLDGIVKTNVVQVVKTAFNNEGSKLKIDSIYGEKQEEFLKRVEDRVREHFAPHGLVVTKIYLLEQFGLPESIRESLDRKVQANQVTAQKQNEVAQAIAEANKVREQALGEKDASISRAEGQAEAIKIVGKAMAENPLYLELKKVETWKGDVPGTLVTNGSTPAFLPLR